MTGGRLFGVCLFLSFCIHLVLMQGDWKLPVSEGGDLLAIPLDISAAVSNPDSSLSLEQSVLPEEEGENAEEAARRLRRIAEKRFLSEVREAVERRKFKAGGSRLSELIGNVRYRFRIRPDDTFTGLHLVRSSGSTELDRAAERAILLASGAVKRPKILAGRSFSLLITVKYQYSM